MPLNKQKQNYILEDVNYTRKFFYHLHIINKRQYSNGDIIKSFHRLQKMFFTF